MNKSIAQPTVNDSSLLDKINHDLKQYADPAFRELVRTRYNMDVENFWGVRTPQIHKIAGKHFKSIKNWKIDERFGMCFSLLETGVYEHKIIAFRWAYLSRNEFEKKHLEVFKKWLDTYVDDWIDCDFLCRHVIGEYIQRFPDTADELCNWCSSPNMWMRRGAAVSLVLPARNGEQLQWVFQVADGLLEDKQDLVRKGYGWLLNEASKHHPQEVFNFVIKRRDRMPRVSLRYAVKKLPEDMRQQALQNYCSQRRIRR